MKKMIRCKYCAKKITGKNVVIKSRGYHLTCIVKLRKERDEKRKRIKRIKDKLKDIMSFIMFWKD